MSSRQALHLLAELTSWEAVCLANPGAGGPQQGTSRSAGNLPPGRANCTAYPWWVSLALPALPDAPETSRTDFQNRNSYPDVPIQAISIELLPEGP